MKKILKLVAVLLLALPLGAQIQTKQALQITIQGVPQSEKFRLDSTYVVSASGYINMWEIGKVRAAGKTADGLAEHIASLYKAKGIYVSPTFQVQSDVDRGLVAKTVTVGGQVRNSGPKPYRKGMTIYDAVSGAGGATAFGAVNRVKLYRNAKTYTYNLKKDAHKRLKIYPGDAIEVPEKNWAGN